MQQYGWILNAFFLSNRSQTPKSTYCMILLLWHSRKGKVTETESRCLPPRVWGSMGAWWQTGCPGNSGGDELVCVVLGVWIRHSVLSIKPVEVYTPKSELHHVQITKQNQPGCWRDPKMACRLCPVSHTVSLIHDITFLEGVGREEPSLTREDQGQMIVRWNISSDILPRTAEDFNRKLARSQLSLEFSWWCCSDVSFLVLAHLPQWCKPIASAGNWKWGKDPWELLVTFL